MAVGDKIKQLDEQVVGRVRQTVEDVQREMRDRLEEATEELRRRVGDLLPRLTDSLPATLLSEDALRRVIEETTEEALRQAQADQAAQAAAAAPDYGALRAAVAAIDRARGQAAVLDALVDAATRFAARAAVLLVKSDGLAGWTARGFEATADDVRGLRLGADEAAWGVEDGPRRLRAADCAALCSRLDSALPKSGLAVPLVLRDKTAGVLYADSGADGELQAEALQVLTYATALALETLAFRERDSTATLAALAEEAPAGPSETTAEASGGAAAEAAPETAVPPRAELEEVDASELDEIELDASELGDEAAPAIPETLRAAAEPQPVTPAESATPPHGDELQPAPTVGGEADEPAYHDAEPAAYYLDETPELAEPEALEDAPELEPEPTESIPWTTEEADRDDAGATDETWPTHPEDAAGAEAGDGPAAVAEAPAAVEEEPAAPEEGPVDEGPAVEPPATLQSDPAPPATEPKAPSGSAEVQPPTDVQGPGWAFSGREPSAADDDPAHAEARRLARLLVNEIKLYNEDAVEAGRAHRDLYERLKDEIDRSREMYEKRVEPEVRDTTDYFYQELVRQLGAGDARVLGI